MCTYVRKLTSSEPLLLETNVCDGCQFLSPVHPRGCPLKRRSWGKAKQVRRHAQKEQNIKDTAHGQKEQNVKDTAHAQTEQNVKDTAHSQKEHKHKRYRAPVEKVKHKSCTEHGKE
jgi:hypothetical protein